MLFTAEHFWKAVSDFKSPDGETRIKATVALLQMAFGPEGIIRERATDVLHANRIAVVRPIRSAEKMA